MSRIYFGDPAARRVPADYDGDSRDDPGIFQSDSSLWAIRSTSRVYFGTTGDTPETREIVDAGCRMTDEQRGLMTAVSDRGDNMAL